MGRRLFLLWAFALYIIFVILPAIAGSETTPTVEAINEPGGGYYGEERHSWMPMQVTVAANGAVAFQNPSTVAHGVEWVSDPAKPNCSSGIPVGNTPAASGTKWSGTCTFAQPGTYTFYCTVHGAAMRGTITVTGPPVPTASTGAVTAASETGATLNGTVNPKGKATSFYFEYGTSTSYGQSTPEESAGEDEADHPESAVVSGLAPGTLYHFQLVATYEAGKSTTLGGDRTFMTASPPAPPEPTPTPGPTPGPKPEPTPGPTPTPPTTTLTQPPSATVLAQPTGGRSAPPAASAATVALTGSQRGAAVHGSLEVPAVDAGAHLQIELLAAGASLAKVKHAGGVLVGRLTRSAVAPGRVSFAVSLSAQGRRALHRHRRLALTVRIVLTPGHGAASVLTRKVSLSR